MINISNSWTSTYLFITENDQVQVDTKGNQLTLTNTDKSKQTKTY